VDPKAELVECFRLDDSTYGLSATGSGRTRWLCLATDGLTLTLASLWLDR
jgi:hypothetical protein